MAEIIKNYIAMLQMLNQVISDTSTFSEINTSFTNWYKMASKGVEETATATVDNSEDISVAKQEFIAKCYGALKGLSREAVISIGEKLAMMYSFMKKNNGASEEALERIYPLCTDAFKEVLEDEAYTELMGGWQNIIDDKPPSEFTLTNIRSDVEVVSQREKKLKEESDKRFALNIRRKVTATQSALIGKKKMEKAGYIFEEGEGVALIKKKPAPAPAPAPEPVKEDAVTNAEEEVVTETSVEVSSSGGVAESKDD
jgi:hypothetical protein